MLSLAVPEAQGETMKAAEMARMKAVKKQNVENPKPPASVTTILVKLLVEKEERLVFAARWDSIH